MLTAWIFLLTTGSTRSESLVHLGVGVAAVTAVPLDDVIGISVQITYCLYVRPAQPRTWGSGPPFSVPIPGQSLLVWFSFRRPVSVRSAHGAGVVALFHRPCVRIEGRAEARNTHFVFSLSVYLCYASECYVMLRLWCYAYANAL